MSRDARRAVKIISVLIIVFNLGPCGRASAHSAGNSPSSNYVSTVKSVTPSSATFTVRTIEAGSRVELRWKSGPRLEIADYDGYPYLRIGPSGVEENQQSYAVYLNKDRMGATPIPANLKPDGAPVWKRISAQPVARWHDHRVHWMGTVRPDTVKANPGRRATIQPFTFDVKQASKTFRVSGILEWVPGPNAAGFIVGAAVLALTALGLALWAGSSDERRDALRPIAAALCIVLAIVDAFHLIGIAFGIHGTFGAALGRMVSVGFVSIIGWVMLGIAAVLLLRRRLDAYYLLILGSGLVTIVGGFADIGVLARSSSPFAFSLSTLRLSIAATIGLGIGPVLVGILLTRRQPSSVAPLNSYENGFAPSA